MPVVVVLGDGEVPGVLEARLAGAGGSPLVVRGPAPEAVNRTALLERGLGVDPAWHDGTGRTLTGEDAARLVAHRDAWGPIARGVTPALVVEAGAVLPPDLAALLDAVTGLLAGGADLVHLDADRDGVAYVVTPRGAAALGSRVEDLAVPVGSVLAEAEVDGFALEPAPVVPAEAPVAGEPLTDHLRIVELVPGEPVEVDAAPGDVLLVLPAGASRVLSTEAEILTAVALAGGDLGTVEGPGGLGPAGSVLAWLDGGADPAAAPGTALHHVQSPRDTGTVVVGGRVVATATSTYPVAVTAGAAALAWLDMELADGGSRDLARILRYDGAFPPGARHVTAVPVASEILQVPLWTPAFCAAVVRAAEAVGAFAPSPEDPVPGHEVSLAAISPRLFAHLEDDLFVRVWPALQVHWPYADFHGLRDAFVIKYALGQQEELRIHHDVAQVSASLKLNEGYVGGVLEFPRQAWDNSAVPVGTLTVWPSLVTHPHRSSPLTSGVKYGLTIWFELPPGAEG
jgi:hypothetical protein